MADDKKSMVEEFKEFIAQGNVMDMAVGIIIGGAFTTIVTSLVDDIIMPILTPIIGGINFSNLKITIGAGGSTINIGTFLNNVVTFLIVAFVVFLMIKSINKAASLAKKNQAPAEETAPAPTCPHCLEEIKEGATRCPHCGGEIPAKA